MKRYKLCHGKGKPVNPGDRTLIGNPVHDESSLSHTDIMFGNKRQVGIKRIRMECTVCGRRLWASISTCDDGCCIYFSIPSHKPKGWWKIKKIPQKKKR